MCLAIVALNAHPRYSLVVAANRDEFHARPADAAQWWPDGILAGRDRAGGGTWFGITRQGRWSLVTNFREGIARDPRAPSRGALVAQALRAADSPLAHATLVAVDAQRFHGFNLLVGNGGEAAYASNRSSGGVALGNGLHGLSNHLLDTPWPKLVGSKARLRDALHSDGDLVAAAFALLADRAPAPVAALPATGVAAQWERVLSPVFIVTDDYGTRCSTVLTVGNDGRVRFVERSFDPCGNVTGEVAQAFELASLKELSAAAAAR
ncbi:MAG: NRDE family protein [Casimicrobiaceae bacterium]